ncbi:hypothetical protein TREES_T100007329 [Tupaia chinensis]|uniref:Uncharacterized protein n=1 Tax=Tupaia chinensis TaxID=246437 RepID=L9KZN2_TUPCH|nr:hypothetical protein TREES_T100007329 [Tupaia chinensis]
MTSCGKSRVSEKPQPVEGRSGAEQLTSQRPTVLLVPNEDKPGAGGCVVDVTRKVLFYRLSWVVCGQRGQQSPSGRMADSGLEGPQQQSPCEAVPQIQTGSVRT